MTISASRTQAGIGVPFGGPSVRHSDHDAAVRRLLDIAERDAVQPDNRIGLVGQQPAQLPFGRYIARHIGNGAALDLDRGGLAEVELVALMRNDEKVDISRLSQSRQPEVGSGNVSQEDILPSVCCLEAVHIGHDEAEKLVKPGRTEQYLADQLMFSHVVELFARRPPELASSFQSLAFRDDRWKLPVRSLYCIRFLTL